MKLLLQSTSVQQMSLKVFVLCLGYKVWIAASQSRPPPWQKADTEKKTEKQQFPHYIRAEVTDFLFLRKIGNCHRGLINYYPERGGMKVE